MHVVIGLHKLFKAKKAYIRGGEEHAKGVSVGGRISGTEGETRRDQM